MLLKHAQPVYSWWQIEFMVYMCSFYLDTLYDMLFSGILLNKQ